MVELLVTLVVIVVGLGMIVSALARGVRSAGLLEQSVQARYQAEATQITELALVAKTP